MEIGDREVPDPQGSAQAALHGTQDRGAKLGVARADVTQSGKDPPSASAPPRERRQNALAAPRRIG
jgi:hypothetical protein